MKSFKRKRPPSDLDLFSHASKWSDDLSWFEWSFLNRNIKTCYRKKLKIIVNDIPFFCNKTYKSSPREN